MRYISTCCVLMLFLPHFQLLLQTKLSNGRSVPYLSCPPLFHNTQVGKLDVRIDAMVEQQANREKRRKKYGTHRTNSPYIPVYIIPSHTIIPLSVGYFCVYMCQRYGIQNIEIRCGIYISYTCAVRLGFTSCAH